MAVDEPAEEAESWPAPRPYLPGAPLPGPRADGYTGNWADAIKEAREAREAWEAAQYPVPAGPRHALQLHALAEMARSADYWTRRGLEHCWSRRPVRYARRQAERIRDGLRGPM